jgi:hypothetical protein
MTTCAGSARAHCPYCDTSLPAQDLCWIHDDWWDDDDPRPCRLCCPVCKAEGEAACADMPGTVIWRPRGDPHA